jgi:hypothetical protein
VTLFRLTLVTATCAALLTVGEHVLIQHQRQREANRLRAENDRMRIALMFRDEGAAGDASFSNTKTGDQGKLDRDPKLSSRTSSSNDGGATDLTSRDYRNEGQSTPLAALQTLAWACDRGDAQTVGKLLCFDPAARMKAANYFASLPLDLRRRWSSIEALAAEVETSDGISHPFPIPAVLAVANVERVGENRVEIQMPGTNHERMHFQKIDSIWKYAITESMVDEYLAQTKPGR